MEQIHLKAMAKINLGLDVVRRMENGYHEVRMIMQTVDLYDELILRKIEKAGIRIITEHAELPTDESNLIYKTIKLLTERYPITGGVEAELHKNIPIAAGMAGGSTDAAAAFAGMNELFELHLSKEQLQEMAVSIGADVPYCIMGGTALAEGIGEILTPLPPAPGCYVLIAKPDISVSTKFVYENLHADTLQKHPDIDGMIQAIESGNLEGVCSRLENVLETVTEKAYPVIAELKGLMKEQRAMNALMSGSGPTVFGIYADRETAETAAEAVRESGMAKQIFVTTFTAETCVRV